MGENFRSLVGSGSPFLKDVYGMAVDLKTAEFIPWTTLIERFVFDKDEPYFNIMVPTADTTRYFRGRGGWGESFWGYRTPHL